MKKKSYSLILMLIGILFAFQSTGQTIYTTGFHSQALDEFKYVNVYVPPGYQTDTDTYYPVIYFLHGWGGSHTSGNSIMKAADDLILQGVIEPVIIVCANNYVSPFNGSHYTNSILWGNYEDYMINDLITWLEAAGRVIPGKNSRVLMGQSMGGFGSFRLGTLHKDKFRGFAAHGSPINYNVMLNDISQELFTESGSGPPYTYDFDNGLFTQLAMSTAGAHSPDLNSPQDYVVPQIVQFPLDEYGNIIDTIYQKWLDHDPANLVKTIVPSDSLAILFGAGVNDELHLYPGNIAMKDTLDKYGIDYEFYNHSGYHTMPPVFVDHALQFLDSVLTYQYDGPNTECLDPSGLTVQNITKTSADLIWVENGDEVSWEINLGLSGFDPAGQTPVTVTSNPYTWSGLTTKTTYDWYIRSNCGAGIYSEWVGPFTFTTKPCDINPATLPFTENWEFQAGQTLYGGSFCFGTHYWTYGNSKPGQGRARWGSLAYQVQNGNGAVTLDRSSTGDINTNYITLTIDLSNYTNSNGLELSFWYSDHGDENSLNDKVWVRGSEVEDWVEIYNLEPASQTDNIYQNVSGLDIDQALAQASPPQAVTHSFQLRFGQQDNGATPSDGISFDGILIEDQPISCIAPSNQTTSNITGTTADLGWTENGGATQWKLKVVPAGTDPSEATPINVFENPYTISGLDLNTDYDWYVQSVCIGGNASDWAGPEAFTTLPCNTAPVSLPFTEDWESTTGTTLYDDIICTTYGYWSFKTDKQGSGRCRWGEEAYFVHSGSGAVTLDTKDFGNMTINSLTLNIDLSAYVNSTDLELSFWWADHKDEEHANDKIWIRGNPDDNWIVIYDLNPQQSSNNTYHLVSGLDIDNTLANAIPTQKVSNATQIRFGQQDNYPTSNDGISFDDIVINDASKNAAVVFGRDNGIQNDTGIKVYAHDGTVYIRAEGEAAEEEKEVRIYDIMGNELLYRRIPAATLQSLPLNQRNTILIVKVASKNGIHVHKVFMD